RGEAWPRDERRRGVAYGRAGGRTPRRHTRDGDHLHAPRRAAVQLRGQVAHVSQGPRARLARRARRAAAGALRQVPRYAPADHRRKEVVGVYSRGRIKWISYAGPDGKTVRESTGQGDHRVAERIYRQRKREVAAGTWVHPKARGGSDRITVADYAERWVERQRQRGLRNLRTEERRLRQHVLPLMGHHVFAAVRPRDVIRFVE